MRSSSGPEALTPLHAWREPELDATPAHHASPRRLLAEGTVAAGCAAAALAVLIATSVRDWLTFPFSDAHDWAAEVLRTERSGAWLAYLWRPHGEQRIPWARLAEALSLEVAGHPAAFLLLGAGLWGLGVAAVALLLMRGPAGVRVRLWLAAAAALLLLCAPLGEDFAFPVFSVYLFAAGPALAAACLWALSGPSLRSPALWAALLCAAAASGGNAAGLAVWPALIGAAVIMGQTGAAFRVLGVAGVACGVLFEAGLGAPGGAPGAASAGAARLVKMAVYFGSYCGLPWSRALRAPVLGALAGAPVAALAVLGLRKGWRLRASAQADRCGRLRRAGVVLALFGLVTALMASVGRVDELAQPIVPTRYTPFALLLQLGVLFLHADRLGAFIEARRHTAAALALLVAVLVLGADFRGARLLDKTADHLRAASHAFDAGLPTDISMYPRPDFAHAVRRTLTARGLSG